MRHQGGGKVGNPHCARTDAVCTHGSFVMTRAGYSDTLLAASPSRPPGLGPLGEPGVRRSHRADDPGRGAARASSRVPTRAGPDLARVCDAVFATYGVDRPELRRRGSRPPSRAALAYVAPVGRRRPMELMAVLGLSRPESVPNLTRRFESWLASDDKNHSRH